MRTSVARIGQLFLGTTAAAVVVALLQIWELIALSPTTVARLVATWALVSVLLGVHALVSTLRDEGPRNRDGDRLID